MYNSQYYTCEQIDQRLLQGYLDDYNSQNNTSLTKAQFLTKLFNALENYEDESEVIDLIEDYLGRGFLYAGLATPTGTPSLPQSHQAQLFFIAINPGTYTNYGNINITNVGLHLILWDTDTWSYDTVLEVDQETGQSTTKTMSQKAITDFLSLVSDSNIKANIGYYECDTAGATAAKVISVVNYALFIGGAIKIKMINANSAANATLNINSTGAKPLYYDGARANASNTWEAGEVLDVYYDGTNFQANNVAGGGKFATGEKVRETGIDVTPTAGSVKLVRSGAVFNAVAEAGVINISEVNKVDTTPAKYSSLSDALAAVPASVQRGGMSIKFILRTNTGTEGEPVYKDEFVQYRLMSAVWSNVVANWQGVTGEIKAGSRDLAESGVVYKYIKDLPIKVNKIVRAWSELGGSTLVQNVQINAQGVIQSATSASNRVLYSKLLKKGTVIDYTATVSTAHATKIGFSTIDPTTRESIVGMQLTDISTCSADSGTMGLRVEVPYDGYMLVGYNINFYSASYSFYLPDDIVTVIDVSALNQTDGSKTKYASLAAARAGVPTSCQTGGLTIKYIDSNTDKYVEYRLTKDTWSLSDSDWVRNSLSIQNYDSEPNTAIIFNGDGENRVGSAQHIIYNGTAKAQSAYQIIQSKTFRPGNVGGTFIAKVLKNTSENTSNHLNIGYTVSGTNKNTAIPKAVGSQIIINETEPITSIAVGISNVTTAGEIEVEIIVGDAALLRSIPVVSMTNTFPNEKTTITVDDTTIGVGNASAVARLSSEIDNVLPIEIGGISPFGPTSSTAHVRNTGFLVAPFNIELNTGYHFIAVYRYNRSINGVITYANNYAASGTSLNIADESYIYIAIIKKDDDTEFTNTNGIISSYKCRNDILLDTAIGNVNDSILQINEGLNNNLYSQRWFNQYLQSNLTWRASENWKVSQLFTLYKGTTIYINTGGASSVILAKFDENNTPIEALITLPSNGSWEVCTLYSYTAEEDILVRACYRYATEGSYIHYNNFPLTRELEKSIKDVNDKVEHSVPSYIWQAKRNVFESTKATEAGVNYSNRIYGNFKKDDIVSFEYLSDDFSTSLAVSDSNNTILVWPLSVNTKTTSVILKNDSSYFSLNRAGAFIPSSGSVTFIVHYHGSTHYTGIYLYPFSCIAGKPVLIYKDAVCAGLKPLANYEVSQKRGGMLQDYTKKLLKLNPIKGNYGITVELTDDKYNVMEHSVRVKCVNMPSTKLSNKESLKVWFMGDSIINTGSNKIGQEFRRMLSTDDAGGTNSDGSIKLPALNVCPGKIQLVGEFVDSTDSNNRWSFQWRPTQVFDEKRDIDYGEPAPSSDYWFSHNIFYNPNSTEPDEIGEDGFNKRVDFVWYFQQMCGEGQYPDLIYLGWGANNIRQYHLDYGFEGLALLVGKIIDIIKKMKAAADVIAGGESGMKIKVFNHQFKPWTSQPTSQGQQLGGTVRYLNFYNYYYNAIYDPANGISDYVSFVDCGSRFDIDNGYDMHLAATNPRCTAVDDELIEESTHMNRVGAYNYADCLVNDFLADSNFD